MLDERIIYTLNNIGSTSVIGVSFDGRSSSNIIFLFHICKSSCMGFGLQPIVVYMIVGVRCGHLTLSLVVVIKAISHVSKDV
jgi:hypothetical protein